MRDAFIVIHSMSPNEIDYLRRLDRSVVWHAFSQMDQYDGLIIESAEGCWLKDIHGRSILDGASSLWCNTHGHRHPAIDAAIRSQLDCVAHVTNLGMSHPTTIHLAEQLVRIGPQGLNHVFFCGDGASAVEVAMKMAFQFWQQQSPPQVQRTKFLVLGNAYHGDTVGTVALGGIGRFHSMFGPLLFPVVRGPCPRNASYGQSGTNADLCKAYLEQYRSLLETHHDEIAAVIVEPIVQCAAGMVFHPTGFLRGIADLCREYDTLLVVDEIAVGFARTGRFFACEHEGVTPDLMCIGKGLTGGYLPMSATLASTRIYDAFLGDASRTLYHGHTYGGNPLAAAAAAASIDLTSERLQSDDFARRQKQLSAGIQRLSTHRAVYRAESLGLLGVLELQSPSPTMAVALCQHLMDRRVWLRPLGNTVPIVPPLVISESELELLLDALEYGLDLIGKVL